MQIRQTDQGVRTEPTESNADGKRDDRLRKCCADFESLLMYEMVKTMRGSISKSDLLHGGQGEELFEQLFDQEVCRSLSERQGFGLGEMLYSQLRGKLTLSTDT